MTRRDDRRIEDIVAAVGAISGYLAASMLDDGLVFDACRMRLVEIGEAVKGMSVEVQEQPPVVPWKDIAGMRDRLAHRYFDTDHKHRLSYRGSGPPSPAVGAGRVPRRFPVRHREPSRLGATFRPVNAW